MPLYGFRCGRGCDPVERTFPMASVPTMITCPMCGADAAKQFGAVAVGHGGSAAMRLLDATSATADAPQITSRVPALGLRGRRRPVSSDPRHRRLPRP